MKARWVALHGPSEPFALLALLQDVGKFSSMMTGAAGHEIMYQKRFRKEVVQPLLTGATRLRTWSDIRRGAVHVTYGGTNECGTPEEMGC